MDDVNDVPDLTTGEWWTLFRMAGHDRYPAFLYPQTLPMLTERGLADSGTETLTGRGWKLIGLVNRLTERDWRNMPKVKIRRAAATFWPERFLDDEDEETRCTAEQFAERRTIDYGSWIDAGLGPIRG